MMMRYLIEETWKNSASIDERIKELEAEESLKVFRIKTKIVPKQEENKFRKREKKRI